MERPTCECHNEPMYTAGRRKDGTQKWKCAVKSRERAAAYNATPEGRAVRDAHNATPKARAAHARRNALYHQAEVADRRMLVSLANRHGCFRCGEKDGQLHRHHISPVDKSFNISEAVSRGARFPDGTPRWVPFEQFYRELLGETIALCPPCHRAEHRPAA